ncbi:MAG: hypothetical protein IKW60_04550 [Clostridia bacterium]|nr:hypothetical protein [Clostridia bacterium]
MKIRPDGRIERKRFAYSCYYGRDWWDFGHISLNTRKSRCAKNQYIEDLKSIASFYGYTSEDIDELIKAGVTAEELEEYLYCGGEI